MKKFIVVFLLQKKAGSLHRAEVGNEKWRYKEKPERIQRAADKREGNRKNLDYKEMIEWALQA